jgi:hypothetical protein
LGLLVLSVETPGSSRISKDGDCPMQDVIDIEITPLSAACGAEIKGIDLARPLSDEMVRATKDACAKHLVLVFRDRSCARSEVEKPSTRSIASPPGRHIFLGRLKCLMAHRKGGK